MDFNQLMRQIAEEAKPKPPKESAREATQAPDQTKTTIDSIPHANVVSAPSAYGAKAEDWDNFDFILGLGEDLLPVVSNPSARISPQSSMKSVGKTPSIYNGNGHAVGFLDWTNYHATQKDIGKWSKNPDFGICLQTRRVRALDVDVSEPVLAGRIEAFVAEHLGIALPKRFRANGSKFLHVFELPGDFFKRAFETEHGIVEFLATKQQAIIAGTHTSGARYEWQGGLPDSIPAISAEQFESLWAALVEQFAIEPPSESSAPSKAKVLKDATHSDPVAQHLYREGFVKKEERDGRLHITCPFEDEHTVDSSDSSTTYFPAHTGGYERGNFDCKHGHCEKRSNSDFLGALGLLAEFDDLTTSGAHLAYYAYLPAHQYIHRPTRQFYPAASVDGNLPGKIDKMRPSQWLDRNRAVQQATWHPSYGEVLKDVIIADGGIVPRGGMLVYNRYRPSIITPNTDSADKWLEHLRRIYPDDAEHLVKWFAHRVQRPGEKINHALVLGGAQGIGKDTVLEPVRRGVGPWNWADIDPKKLTGAFNPFVESVVLRINEARDLGDLDRFAFYDHSKTYIAAPPDVLTCNNKHAKEYPVFNVMGVILTTNHKTNGIYLPLDDRRHYVAWSESHKEDFTDQYWRDFWGWMDSGGDAAVVGFLQSFDLSDFNPKAPPPKTEAFYAIVQANANPEDVGLVGITTLEDSSRMPAVTLGILHDMAIASDDIALANVISDHRNRRRIPHMLERAGYAPVRNPDAEDGMWRVNGKRQAIYALAAHSIADRVNYARRLVLSK